MSGSSAVRTGVVQRPKDKILSMDPKEITYDMVQKKLQEIAMARGKTTRIDRQEQASCQNDCLQLLLLIPSTQHRWKHCTFTQYFDVEGAACVSHFGLTHQISMVRRLKCSPTWQVLPRDQCRRWRFSSTLSQ